MADVIDALIAEALGEGPEGLAAVAHVIQARAQATGKTPEQVVNEAGQFSGVKTPGRIVAQALTNPDTRAQVQQIWSGVQNGTIPNPYPGATHFHTPSVNPSWSGEFQRLGQKGNHIFYADGSAPQNRRVEPSMPTDRPETALSAIEAATSPWLTYTNQNATRNQPLNPGLERAMSFLPELGVTMNVYSGGQDASGPNRTGSTRHDHGNAADVMFYKDGRMLDWNNPSDLPLLSDIVSRAKAGGVTGIGAGNDYMGPGRVHIGFGDPTVWGAGGRRANAPDWLVNAYYGAPSGPIMNARATGTPTPNTQRPGQGGGGIWGNPLGFVRQQVAGLTAPVQQLASSPQVQQAAIGPLMGSLAGRNLLSQKLMNMNIGAAPQVSQGWGGSGTRALAVNNRGASPIMLSSSGGSGAAASGAHGNWSPEVYRANAAVLGSGGFNQPSIDRAISDGKTLTRRA